MRQNHISKSMWIIGQRGEVGTDDKRLLLVMVFLEILSGLKTKNLFFTLLSPDDERRLDSFQLVFNVHLN